MKFCSVSDQYHLMLFAVKTGGEGLAVVDGYELLHHPHVLIKNGQFNYVPFLGGNNLNEDQILFPILVITLVKQNIWTIKNRYGSAAQDILMSILC